MRFIFYSYYRLLYTRFNELSMKLELMFNFLFSFLQPCWSQFLFSPAFWWPSAVCCAKIWKSMSSSHLRFAIKKQRMEIHWPCTIRAHWQPMAKSSIRGKLKMSLKLFILRDICIHSYTHTRACTVGIKHTHVSHRLGGRVGSHCRKLDANW